MLDQRTLHRSPPHDSHLTIGMIHDCGISRNWIIFILLPMCVSLDRLKEGGKHFMWDNDLPMVLGLLPLHDPKPENQRWYPYKPQTFIGHIGNAFDIDEHIVCLDTPLDNGNVFGGFFPDKEGKAPPAGSVEAEYVRFRIDTRKPSGSFIGEPEVLVKINGGMPRIDDRFVGEKARYGLLSVHSTPKWKRLALNEGGVAGRGFPNSIGLVDTEERRAMVYWSGEMSAVGEPVFIPRSPDSPEGDGYVMFMVSRLREQHAELVIVDLADFINSKDDGDDIKPVARIVLPFRLRSGIHGSWVPASDLGEWQQLCDMQGVDEKLMETFGDKVYHGTAKGEVLRGHARSDGDNHGGVDGHARGAEVMYPHSEEWLPAIFDRLRLGPDGWGTKTEVNGK
jgi:carotenoid cleavage dioxygenase-like enzyme